MSRGISPSEARASAVDPSREYRPETVTVKTQPNEKLLVAGVFKTNMFVL